MLHYRSMLRIPVYFWAFPTSCLGLLFLVPTLFSGGRCHIHTGVLEIHGGLTRLFLARGIGLFLTGGASAMTLGHVVLARDRLCLLHTRSHERIHVRQCERWGPLFLPAYLLASLYQLLRRRDPYQDNPFEREAYANESLRSSP